MDSSWIDAMCSRYELSPPPNAIAERFGLIDCAAPLAREIRPTNQALVITAERRAVLRRWGLAAPWDGKPLINARAETLAERPTFRPLLESRVLIPASAFFEWRTPAPGEAPGKRKNRLARPDGRLFAMAGLSDGACFTVVTCPPSAVAARIHNRMPAILSPEVETLWLDPGAPVADVLALLAPYPHLEAVEERPPPPDQGDLFG